VTTDERIERCRLLYERALFQGDRAALVAAGRELDAVEADLTLARGRLIHGRFLEQRTADPDKAAEDLRELALFDRAVRLYQALGDLRGEAEALFWVGCCHQVDRRGSSRVHTSLFEVSRRRQEAATSGAPLRVPRYRDRHAPTPHRCR